MRSRKWGRSPRRIHSFHPRPRTLFPLLKRAAWITTLILLSAAVLCLAGLRWPKTQTVARGIYRTDGPSIKALPTALLHELRQA